MLIQKKSTKFIYRWINYDLMSTKCRKILSDPDILNMHAFSPSTLSWFLLLLKLIKLALTTLFTSEISLFWMPEVTTWDSTMHLVNLTGLVYYTYISHQRAHAEIQLYLNWDIFHIHKLFSAKFSMPKTSHHLSLNCLCSYIFCLF